MVRIMFLCTGNSCRSHIAEGFARYMGKGLIEAHSAGLLPAGFVHPKAIAVMKEVGIDISDQKSKAIDPDLLMSMDMVITLCGSAEESCPWTPPQIRRIHWPIEDPAAAAGTGEEIMGVFRKVRDEIKERIQNLILDLRKEERKV